MSVYCVVVAAVAAVAATAVEIVVVVVVVVVGPLLNRRLKERNPEPDRVSSVFTFVSVCLSVCVCVFVRGLQGRSFKLET